MKFKKCNSMMTPPHLFRPVNLSIWLNHFLPYIRAVLKLPADDTKTVRYWLDRGISTEPIDFTKYKYNKAICFGAGPHLERYTDILKSIDPSDYLTISADGATRWLLKKQFYPDFVITDLDGITNSDISLLIENNVEIQILTHGDNISKVNEVAEELSEDDIQRLKFSTQGRPFGTWQNTLGFTDGDRAVSLATKIVDHTYLIGYDLFSNKIGKFSKPYYQDHQPMTTRKRIKLDIASLILKWFSYNYNIYIENYQFGPGIELSFRDFDSL